MNRFTLVGAALALSAGPVAAADYQIETVAEGLSNPWSLAFLPDGGMLVTERSGPKINDTATNTSTAVASGWNSFFQKASQ